jgi:hypothetical protein
VLCWLARPFVEGTLLWQQGRANCVNIKTRQFPIAPESKPVVKFFASKSEISASQTHKRQQDCERAATHGSSQQLPRSPLGRCFCCSPTPWPSCLAVPSAWCVAACHCIFDIVSDRYGGQLLLPADAWCGDPRNKVVWQLNLMHVWIILLRRTAGQPACGNASQHTPLNIALQRHQCKCRDEQHCERSSAVHAPPLRPSVLRLKAGAPLAAPGGATAVSSPATSDLPPTGTAAQATRGSSLSAHSRNMQPPGHGNPLGVRLPAGGAPMPHVIAPPSGPMPLAPAPPLALANAGGGAAPEVAAAIAVRMRSPHSECVQCTRTHRESHTCREWGTRGCAGTCMAAGVHAQPQ